MFHFKADDIVQKKSGKTRSIPTLKCTLQAYLLFEYLESALEEGLHTSAWRLQRESNWRDGKGGGGRDGEGRKGVCWDKSGLAAHKMDASLDTRPAVNVSCPIRNWASRRCHGDITPRVSRRRGRKSRRNVGRPGGGREQSTLRCEGTGGKGF